jgi:hypothetical protein
MKASMADASKTTLFLADSRRAALKAIAVERRTTVTALVSEGADLVIEKYRALGDREELARRATAARSKLRGGLFDGPGWSGDVDAVVYPRRPTKPKKR